MSQAGRLLAGAMSGTSGDGVDVAIVEIIGTGLEMSARLLHHHHLPFDADLRTLLFAIRDAQQFQLRDLAALGRNISLTYARAINEALFGAKLHADQLSAVAAHGQTLYHDPPNTIQWFDPALVAAEVGCAVISDFRRADCAAGGQGAPLVPFADYIQFRDPHKSRVLLNIGGIANITCIPAGASMDQIIAFDTGPGNCVADYLCRKFDPGGPGYDEDGGLACSGSLDRALRDELKRCPYFQRVPPKSTDGPEMIAWFEHSISQMQLPASLEHLLANAAWWTVWAILREVPEQTAQIIVSGGGTRNRFMMTKLRRSRYRIVTSDELGVNPDAKEALAFALLGAATLDGVPSNLPRATGARRAVVLGSITPRP